MRGGQYGDILEARGRGEGGEVPRHAHAVERGWEQLRAPCLPPRTSPEASSPFPLLLPSAPQETQKEVSKYGKLREVVIPKPAGALSESDPPGVGLVFLYYEDAAGAGRARLALDGRTFGGQPIEAGGFSKERFVARDFS